MKISFLTSYFMLSLPRASTSADTDCFIWGDLNLYSSTVLPLRIPVSSRLNYQHLPLYGADLDNPLDFGYTDISVCGKKTFSFVNWDSSLQPLSCLLIQWHSEPKISRWHSWFIRFTSITLYSLVKRDFVWLWFFVCFCFYHRKHNLIQPKGVDTSRNKTQNFVNGPLGKTVRVVTRISMPSYMG